MKKSTACPLAGLRHRHRRIGFRDRLSGWREPEGAVARGAVVHRGPGRPPVRPTYTQNCASCHGANMDDGEFAPPLKGVEFRSASGSASRPTSSSPRSRRCRRRRRDRSAPQKHAELLAYLMSQNQLAASDKPVPSDLDQLKAMLLPGVRRRAERRPDRRRRIPPAPPVRANPLDKYTPVTDAMLQNPPAGDWLTWRRGYDGQGFSPLQADHQAERRRPARGVELVAAQRPERRHAARSTTACCSCTPTATRCRRSTPPPAICCGSTRAGCRWASRRASSAAIAIYGDKVYTGTSDAHIVALDAKTGRVVWDKAVADHEGGYGLTGGVTVAKGKVIASTTGRAPRRQLHRRARCQHGRRGVALQHHPAGERAGRQHLERRAVRQAQRRFGVDARQLRPGDATSSISASRRLTTPGRIATCAPGQNNDLLYTDSTLALNPGHGQAGVALPAPAQRSVGLRLGVRPHRCSRRRPTARRWSAPAASRRSSTSWRPTRASTRSRSISACRTS